jgi:DNA (cytosine-5)-methyltransferase 1
MRRSTRQLSLATDIMVDLFAGGGGTSLGLEMALGRSPDIAVNHDEEAVAMHAANHPRTHHLCGDVWDVDPTTVARGRRVALLWASPDCRHFSRAKGSAPKGPKIRALAWVVVRWAKAVRPRVILVENVAELMSWGPLLADGQPDKAKAGTTFRAWVRALERAGYAVEWRELRACDFGIPTTRKRLFVVARCDGRPIVWPEPTHGPGRLPYLTAASCIDWSLPCPSIFDRKKPLASKTMARIARGIRRFVLEHPRPFIVPTAHAGDLRVHSIDEPLRTITGQRRGDHALIAPTLVQTGYGERPGQAPRSLDLSAPLGTVVGCGQRHALVAAFLSKQYGGHEGPGASLHEPASTVTGRDHHGLVAAHLSKLYGTSTGSSAEAPAPVVTGMGGHLAEVRAFLTQYNGTSVGATLAQPAPVVTSHDRFGLVTVHGETYAIADIGFRMLSPRELFRAQGFPDSWIIDPLYEGKPLTKTAQIRCAGNSVCPPVAAALVSANVAQEEVAVA